MINNRQAGRRRGRGGQQRTPGNPGRPEQGNRIDNRARGNAAQLLEKYKMLARDAQMQGDRVNTEYYLQFADHYFRVLSETRARFEEQNPGQNQSQGQNQQRRPREEGAMDEFAGEDREADEGDRRPRYEQYRPEQQRPRAENNGECAERPATEVEARDVQARPERTDQPERNTPLNGHDAVSETAAPRRGRPRRIHPVDTEATDSFDAAILPPSVNAASPAPAPEPSDDAAAEQPAPRRRGRPRKVQPEDIASA